MDAKLTVDDLLIELEEARIGALEGEQYSAAVNASVAKARLLGLLVERKEVGLTVHKPGFTREAVELTEEEWTRQWALPGSVPDTTSNDR